MNVYPKNGPVYQGDQGITREPTEEEDQDDERSHVGAIANQRHHCVCHEDGCENSEDKKHETEKRAEHQGQHMKSFAFGARRSRNLSDEI